MVTLQKLTRRNFKAILILTFCVALIYYFVQPKSFESTVSLYPSYQNDTSISSNLMDIASEFGVGKKINSNNAVIYTPDIIKSFSLRKAILLNDYISLNDTSLLEYFISNELNIFNSQINYDDKMQEYANSLEEKIFVSIGRVSGLITIKTYFHSSALSSEVCDFIYIYLKDFINQSTIESSQARLKYYEERLLELSENLKASENELEKFLIANKDIQSPLLQTQYLRFIREVELDNQTYSLLNQQIESEKIQLKKDELNFVISDKFSDIEEQKSSAPLILLVTLFFDYLIYLWAFKADTFFRLVSNKKSNQY